MKMRDFYNLSCRDSQCHKLSSNKGLKCSFIFVVVLALLFSASGELRAANKTKKLPSLSRVQRVIEMHFAGKSDYRAQDLIDQSDATVIFSQLLKMGWRVDDQKAILDEMLPSNHFLVTQFQNSKGRKFMRKLASNKRSYSRLDRLSQMKGGQKSLVHLIKTPKSDKFLQNFSADGFRALAKTMPRGAGNSAPRWKEVEKPTKKIYTAGELKSRLDKSYLLAQRKNAAAK